MASFNFTFFKVRGNIVLILHQLARVRCGFKKTICALKQAKVTPVQVWRRKTKPIYWDFQPKKGLVWETRFGGFG